MFDLASGYYDFEDINHAAVGVMAELRPHLPARPSVLDVGCGRGQQGQSVRRLGYRVTGIERNADALRLARERLDEVVDADLADAPAVTAALEGRWFEVILFADVLEHLSDPLTILRFYRRFLAPGGRIVISVPNIACWDRRLALLFGRFDYADSGVMDRTHLRFFTFRTLHQLLREAGMAPQAVRHTPGIVRAFLPLIKRLYLRNSRGGPPNPDAILSSPAYRFYEKWLLPVEQAVSGLRREVLAFRIVVLAVPVEW